MADAALTIGQPELRALHQLQQQYHQQSQQRKQRQEQTRQRLIQREELREQRTINIKPHEREMRRVERQLEKKTRQAQRCAIKSAHLVHKMQQKLLKPLSHRQIKRLLFQTSSSTIMRLRGIRKWENG